MKLTTRQLTLCGILTTLALALSVAENQIPLSLAIPIPGIKLGLANIVTVFALYALGPAQAVLILLARCLLGAVFAGNMNALLFSLMGGFAAMGMMILLTMSSTMFWNSPRKSQVSLLLVQVAARPTRTLSTRALMTLMIWGMFSSNTTPGRVRRPATSVSMDRCGMRA